MVLSHGKLFQTIDIVPFLISKDKFDVIILKLHFYNNLHFLTYLHPPYELCMLHKHFLHAFVLDSYGCGICTGQQPMTRLQSYLHKEHGQTIYFSVMDKIYDLQETKGLYQKELKKYYVSKFLQYCQPASQVLYLWKNSLTCQMQKSQSSFMLSGMN